MSGRIEKKLNEIVEKIKQEDDDFDEVAKCIQVKAYLLEHGRFCTSCCKEIAEIMEKIIDVLDNN